MAYKLSDINSAARTSPGDFIEACDVTFHNRIVEAADRICRNMETSPIVLLSGPSGSGKTTTAKKVEEELRSRGVNSYTVSMDDYLKTIDPRTAPRTPEGELDFESPECLDMELLNEHFSMLSCGKEIHIPTFMFSRQKRSASRFTPMQLRENEIAIFEGIHALNDSITNTHPEAFKLYISAASDVENDGEVLFTGMWMRLVRRAVRDSKFRGADAAFTLSMWENVLDGEVKHIAPFMNKASLILDSSLPYEVSVMKVFAEPLFAKVPEDTPRYEELTQICSAFEHFEPLSAELVPPNSLIREFIGGGIYEY